MKIVTKLLCISLLVSILSTRAYSWCNKTHSGITGKAISGSILKDYLKEQMLIDERFEGLGK